MTRRELDMLLEDLFEGCLEGAAFDRLQGELRASAEAREAYRESLHLHHALMFRSKGVDLLHVVPMEKVAARRLRRTMLHAVMAAAAVLLLGALVMALVIARTPQPSLSFATSPGAALSLSHQLDRDDFPAGQVLEPGSRLVLQRGSVELDFASGVRGIVRAPADLTLLREDLLDLSHGTAWFEVPRKAVGFQVRTPRLVLTDLGTEFGLLSGADFLDEVHVFSGKVEVLNRHGLKLKEVIGAGQARVAGPAGRWHETELRRGAFLTELPTTGTLPVVLDDSAVFTSSPENQMIRQSRYTFTSHEDLLGFDPANSDKLVVTLSHERGSIREVTYGGVRMSSAVRSSGGDLRQTAIFHLDRPGSAGDLVVTMAGSANGVGGSLLALSNAAPGGPVASQSSQSTGTQLVTKQDHCFIVASHVVNGNKDITALPPLSLLFSGPTGSSMGGSGYLMVKSASAIRAAFSSGDDSPATVVAAFAPVQ